MRPGSIPTSNRPCFRTNFLVLVLSETVLVLSETVLGLSETGLGLSETGLGLLFERSVMAEPTFDHDRLDVDRLSIAYVRWIQ